MSQNPIDAEQEVQSRMIFDGPLGEVLSKALGKPFDETGNSLARVGSTNVASVALRPTAPAEEALRRAKLISSEPSHSWSEDSWLTGSTSASGSSTIVFPPGPAPSSGASMVLKALHNTHVPSYHSEDLSAVFNVHHGQASVKVNPNQSFSVDKARATAVPNKPRLPRSNRPPKPPPSAAEIAYTWYKRLSKRKERLAKKLPKDPEALHRTALEVSKAYRAMIDFPKNRERVNSITRRAYHAAKKARTPETQ